MNRYDAHFNDVDPTTSRPFNWGHPDGVWTIAIIYGLLGLISFAVIAVGVYRLFTSGLPGLPILLAGSIELFQFSSAIVLFFKRSEKSLHSASAILALFAAGLVIAGFTGLKPFLGAFVAYSLNLIFATISMAWKGMVCWETSQHGRSAADQPLWTCL